MSSLRILLDCDGVLADFAGAICVELTASGFPRKAEEITAYRLEDCLNSAETKIAHAAMRRPGFAWSLSWYPGARSFVDALEQIGEVVIVTTHYAPSETWVHDREQWLSGLGCRVVYTEHKELIWGNVLIEDRPENCAKWAAAYPEGTTILMDRPWNRRAPGLRAHTFSVALEYIRGML